LKVDEILGFLSSGKPSDETESFRNDLYDEMRPIYEKIFELTDIWNKLAPKLSSRE